jgi:hypothetical protein
MDSDNPETEFRTLLLHFQRCQNYPRGNDAEAALIVFAEALEYAQNSTGIPAAEIVERCRKLSEYCPTDHDLLSVAHEIKAERLQAAEQKQEQRRRQEWAEELKREGLEPQRPGQSFSTALQEADPYQEWHANAKKKLDEDARIMHEVAERLGVPFTQLYKKSWGQIYVAMKELGYKLNGAQQEIMAGTTIPPRK